MYKTTTPNEVKLADTDLKYLEVLSVTYNEHIV